MTSSEVTQKQSSEAGESQSSALQSTKETVSSVAANLSGAFNFSGGVSANAGSYNKKTETVTGGGQKVNKIETDQQQQQQQRIE